MSRLRRIEHTARYFFVTTNLAAGVPPLTGRERDICLGCLEDARKKHGFLLFGYAVMPDHAHLVLGVFKSSLPVLMRDWKRQSGFAVGKARHSCGPIWQPRYFDFILRDVGDLGKKLEYVHQNPVAAGLVARPEDWLWSSAGFHIAHSTAPVQLDVLDVPADRNAPLWPVRWK